MRCAGEMQRKFQKEPIVPLRIGIHIGEILLEDGKVFGDGVNLASRIESLGQAGTVLFPRHVFDKIRNNPEFKVSSLGNFEFKNVEMPMEVFALANEGFPVPKREEMKGKLKTPVSSKPKIAVYLRRGMIIGTVLLLVLAGFLYNNFLKTKSDDFIAVLPFDNDTGDPEQDDLSLGIAEEIINEESFFYCFRPPSAVNRLPKKN